MSSEAKPNSVKLIRKDSGVAIIVLGDSTERAVILTAARLRSLGAVLDELHKTPPKGLVITGPTPEMFTVGADISVIKSVTDPKVGEQLAREGQSIFDKIESLPCRTVAAISGPCVGGGCELVLACSVRLISDHKASSIGLPETKLGILPGFGGTQRLPRLVGVPKALDIILKGKVLRPYEAHRVGLVNEVVLGPVLMDKAERIALGKESVRKPKVKFIDKLVTNFSLGRSRARGMAEKEAKKGQNRFYPALLSAIDAVFYGLERGQVEGLKHEAIALGKLISTPESKGLVRVFELTEGAKGLGKVARKDVSDVRAVVVGSGVMGAGIAQTLARSEAQVTLRDTTDQALDRAVKQIKESLSKQRSLTEAERTFILNRIETTTKDSSSLASVNVAIEAVFEDLAVKQKVLGDLAKNVPESAILATNTSSISVSQIAETIPHPDRVIGMHFFNPVDRMPLVEIVRGKKTSDRSIVVVAALTSKLGKFPIVVEDVPGFLINRILSPYLGEAGFLLSEGFSPTDIDRAATDFGLPMGPVRLLDEIGLDVASHVSEIMTKGYGDRMKSPAHTQELVKLGRKGKKSGAGFYTFTDGEAAVDPTLLQTLKITAKPSAVDLQKIQNRLVYRLINEAVRCLDEGVAGKPSVEAASQIDLGLIMGAGFPPFRGGLLEHCDRVGAKTVQQTLEGLAKEFGERFSPWQGIKRRADLNKSFKDAVVMRG